MASAGLRCRHAFEAASVHANGEVVCSIIDGRGDFVLGNVHTESIRDILSGPRPASCDNSSCRPRIPPAIARPSGTLCAQEHSGGGRRRRRHPALRFLAIEPTTAWTALSRLSGSRLHGGDVTWRDAFRDGGAAFLVWDGVRRGKQHAADAVLRALPMLQSPTIAGSVARRRTAAAGSHSRHAGRGTLPIDVLKRVVTDAGPRIERIEYVPGHVSLPGPGILSRP